MATRAQKTKVGLFVVVCLAIIVVGILIVSGYKREDYTRYWIEFDESVLGLSSASIVEYQGVPVGTVGNIYVNEKNKPHCEIRITIGKVKLHQGVKAQLVLYSLATGTMSISLKEGDTAGPELAAGSEIPSEKSLVKSLSTEIEGVLDRINKISESILSGMANMKEGDITKLLNDADDLLKQVKGFVEDAGKTMADIKGSAQTSIEDIRKLVKDTNDTVLKVGEKVGGLKVDETQENLNKVLKDISALSERLQDSAKNIDGVSKRALHEADNLEYNLRDTLRTLNDSLESVRGLTQNLQQDPSSVIFGKGKPKGKK